MSAVKTYILAPNFSLQLDGAVRIGNIIADPFRPSKILSSSDPSSAPLEIATTTQLESSIRHVDSKSGHGSVWAYFLNTVGGHLSAGSGTDVTTQYNCDRLDTMYLKYDPTEGQITTRLQDAKVQAAMNAGMFGKQPVYMITGLKVARGFRFQKQVTRKYEGGVGVTVPVVDGVSVGGEIGGARGNEVEESSQVVEDIIFAYQLHKIAVKGRRTKSTSVDVYTPKAALLHDQNPREDTDAEITAATTQDMQEVIGTDDSSQLQSARVQDEDGHCTCIALIEGSD